MPVTEQPTLLHSAFPVTGQPIRVVVINGEPWFSTADVCRILGRDQPHRASKIVEPHEPRFTPYLMSGKTRNRRSEWTH
jgi:prophage antirepressor-like protein